MKVRDTLVYIFRNPMIFVAHLTFWFLCFLILLVVIFIDEGLNDVVRFIDDGLFIILVLTSITSYRGARGYLKGIARIQQVWMNWYNRQMKTKVQGSTFKGPPLTDNTEVDSYFKKAKNTLKSLVRNPIPLFIHFTFWTILFGAGIYLDDPMQVSIMEGSYFSSLMNEFLSEYLDGLPILLMLTLITSFLEAHGNINGITLAQKSWLQWYNQQIETNRGQGTSDNPPVLLTNQSVAIFTFRSPERVIIESVCWIMAYSLCTVLLSSIGIVDNPNFFIKYLSFAVILAL